MPRLLIQWTRISAPFVRYDQLDYRAAKQLIQQMVFAMNVPSRWGSQAPFLNFSFDWVAPEDLKDRPVIIGGRRKAGIWELMVSIRKRWI